MRIYLLNCLLFLIWPSVVFCQDIEKQPDTASALAFTVFADCNECGNDYLRTEITFVDVQVLATRFVVGYDPAH